MPSFVKSFCGCIQQRILVGGLISLVVLISYFERKTYASTVREMVYQKPPKLDPESLSFCPFMLQMRDLDVTHNLFKVKPDFFWNAELTRSITQSFFIGFFILSIPAGMLADYFGARWLVGFGVFFSSLCTLLFPLLAHTGPYYFMFGRFCQGSAQAIGLSSIAVVLARWVPHTERATFMGVIFSMKQFGYFIGQCHLHLFRHLQFSWELMCYTSGSLGLLGSIFLLVFVSGSPVNCSHITRKEEDYILRQTKDINTSKGQTHPIKLVPWKLMFTSKPFLSMLLFQFGWSWIRITLVNRLDKYLIHVVHLTKDLTYNTMAFSGVSMAISSLVGGFAVDYLINNGIMSRTWSRKLFGFLGNALPLPLMFLVLAAGCNGPLVCGMFVVMFYVNGLVDCSFGANMLDLAPRHAGVSFAILNCTTSCSVILNRVVYAFICVESSSVGQWLHFLLVCSGVTLSCSLPFLCLSSAKVQHYNHWYSQRLPHSHTPFDTERRPSDTPFDTEQRPSD